MTVLPRQVLHVGNILNNGYLHAKYLRQRGVGAESLNVGYTHCQGQPEWCEARLSGPVSHWDEDWGRFDLDGFVRPCWYHQTTTADLPRLAAALSGADVVAQCETRPLGSSLVRTILGPASASLRQRVVAGLEVLGLGDTVRRVRQAVHSMRIRADGMAGPSPMDTARRIIADYDRIMPEADTRLTAQDVLDLLPPALAHAPVFNQFQLIQAYSLDPIHALLGTPGKPFLAYEHGTMRDFPFEDSARGRLYRLALHQAETVFITNADCIASARRLGLDNWVYIPHLIDDERFRPEESPLRAGLLAELDADHLVVAPARHHWKNAPPGLANSFFKRNDILIRGLGRLLRRKPGLRLGVVFFEYGAEVDLSKRLIAEEGIADRVKWAPLSCKLVTKDYFNAADVICDQFCAEIKAFGAVVAEGLACGKPVISTLDAESNGWAFPVLPPVLHAVTEEAVENHLDRLFADDDARRRQGEAGLAWYLAHHHSSLVIDRMVAAYQAIYARHGWDWTFP